jgi:predicted metalloprotease
MLKLSPSGIVFLVTQVRRKQAKVDSQVRQAMEQEQRAGKFVLLSEADGNDDVSDSWNQAFTDAKRHYQHKVTRAHTLDK